MGQGWGGDGLRRIQTTMTFDAAKADRIFPTFLETHLVGHFPISTKEGMNPPNFLLSPSFDPIAHGVSLVDAFRDPVLFPPPALDATAPIYAIRLTDAAKLTGVPLQDFHNAHNQGRLACYRTKSLEGTTFIYTTPGAVVDFLVHRGPRKGTWRPSTILLDQISSEEPFQLRTKPRENKIQSIAEELIRGGGINVPVWLFSVRLDSYFTVDGHHRVAGSRSARRKSIPAIVLPIPFWFARIAAFEANLGQATDLTTDEAANYARALLRERPDLHAELVAGTKTQREAAVLLGVGQGTVSKILNEGRQKPSKITIEDFKAVADLSSQHLQHMAPHEHLQVIAALSVVTNELKRGVSEAEWKAAVLGLKTKSTAFAGALGPNITPLFSPRGGQRSKGLKGSPIPGIAPVAPMLPSQASMPLQDS